MMRQLALTSLALLAACSQPPSEQPAAVSAPRSDADPAYAITEANAEQAFAPGAGLAEETQGADYLGQPAGERAAQQRLPHSPDALWRTLTTTRITEDVERGLYTAQHSSAVRALAGRRVTITGFVMALEAEPRFRHFLLSRYTPVCDFCPPGAPNEVVEVWSATAISPSYNLMRATGRFSLTNDAELGLFFRIDGATVEPVG